MRKFPHKLWSLINKNCNEYIKWNASGDSILLKFHEFEKKYLNQKQLFFKTTKMSSFVRQLNLYGFRKANESSDYHEYKHRYFKKNCYHLLKYVTRKYSKTTKHVNDCEHESEQYEQKKVTKDQKRIKLKFDHKLKRKENNLDTIEFKNKSTQAVELEANKVKSMSCSPCYDKLNQNAESTVTFSSQLKMTEPKHLFFHYINQIPIKRVKYQKPGYSVYETKLFNHYSFNHRRSAYLSFSFDASFAEDAPIDSYTF